MEIGVTLAVLTFVARITLWIHDRYYKRNLDRKYLQLATHKIVEQQSLSRTQEQFKQQYLWTILGFVMLASIIIAYVSYSKN